MACVHEVKGLPSNVENRGLGYNKHPFGIKDFHFHDLRHEPTSRLFDKEQNPVEIATIAGHRDPRMLMRYTHLRAEHFCA